MSKWLGPTGEHAPGEVPKWAGVSARGKMLVGVLWPAVAVAVLALLRLRLPDDVVFGGFLPIFIAILVFSAGSSATERGMVRGRDSAAAH